MMQRMRDAAPVSSASSSRENTMRGCSRRDKCASSICGLIRCVDHDLLYPGLLQPIERAVNEGCAPATSIMGLGM